MMHRSAASPDARGVFRRGWFRSKSHGSGAKSRAHGEHVPGVGISRDDPPPSPVRIQEKPLKEWMWPAANESKGRAKGCPIKAQTRPLVAGKVCYPVRARRVDLTPAEDTLSESRVMYSSKGAASFKSILGQRTSSTTPASPSRAARLPHYLRATTVSQAKAMDPRVAEARASQRSNGQKGSAVGGERGEGMLELEEGVERATSKGTGAPRDKVRAHSPRRHGPAESKRQWHHLPSAGKANKGGKDGARTTPTVGFRTRTDEREVVTLATPGRQLPDDLRLRLVKASGGGGGDALFHMEVRTLHPGQAWSVCRRHAEFARLHSAMQTCCHGGGLPLLPRPLHDSPDVASVERVRAALQAYVSLLSDKLEVWYTEEFILFLDPEGRGRQLLAHPRARKGHSRAKSAGQLSIPGGLGGEDLSSIGQASGGG
ncbi:unnamed protein product, partial [Discosporangium mesarthrocarpum]